MSFFDLYQKKRYRVVMSSGTIKRYLVDQIREDLESKMVFLGGPRQVGKTTLSLILDKDPGYLNWDIPTNRRQILAGQWPDKNLLILDEIHKYRKWRNLLKGFYDAMVSKQLRKRRVLVTGSARLDTYRYGGDSLQGRYHYLRLLPLTLKELGGGAKTLFDLMKLGGFPEPFFSQSERQAQRWRNEYFSRLLREDIRDLENLKDLGTLELLAVRLPECVGSPLSVNALREDLGPAHATIRKWIELFERLYYVFRIPPMGGSKIRAVKKEAKLYFFDWMYVQDEGARFENMIAVHLCKYIYWLQDTQGKLVELRYFRDTDGREVDFVVLERNKPILFVECKKQAKHVPQSLRYLKAKYPGTESIVLSLNDHKEVITSEGIRICAASEWLMTLV